MRLDEANRLGEQFVQSLIVFGDEQYPLPEHLSCGSEGLAFSGIDQCGNTLA